MPQGRLRIYFGVAPGVGATHAMLDEGRRRRARGADVVIGSADLHGRPPLVELATGLEWLGTPGSLRLDPDAVIARRPAVVLVDELAGIEDPAEPPGARWAAVRAVLAAGIDVVGTVDVRAVRSLRDELTTVMGERPTHTLPDAQLLSADQIQLVDMTPAALRRRLAHGGLYPPGTLDAQRSARLQPGTLAAMRELALRWVATTAPVQHEAWLAALGTTQPQSMRSAILVALPDSPQAAHLLDRAATLTAGMPGTALHAVHVSSGRSPQLSPGSLAHGADRVRVVAEEAGATYHAVIGDDIAASVRDVATAVHAHTVVVGARQPARLDRSPLSWVWRPPGVAARLAAATDLDLHVVPLPGRAPLRRATNQPPLSALRRGLGFAHGAVLPPLLTAVLLLVGGSVGLAGDVLLMLVAVVVTTLVGGLGPALLGALVASTLLNWYFIPPVHTLQISEPHNIVTLVGFAAVALLVSAVVHRAASLSAEAARAATESRALSAIAESTLRGSEALPALVEQLRSAFGMVSVSLLRRRAASDAPWARDWQVEYASGPEPAQRPEDAEVQVPAGADLVLALTGRTLAASDRTILRAFAAQAQGLLERDRLARTAAVADRLAATERLRDALLAAVGHDLRTPLAAARAAVDSLRSADVDWSSTERGELLDAAEESLTRLASLVADLLDLSRLRAGVLTVARDSVWLDDLVPPALDELGLSSDAVTLAVPQELPPAVGDPGLVTRVVVNLVGNAIRYSPPGQPPLVAASATAERVELRVIDKGPGIPPEDVERVFTAFQRLGDSQNRTGLGLGLALSRGLVEAMGGTLVPEETPGGGLTMVMSLPAAGSMAAETDVPVGHREREEVP